MINCESQRKTISCTRSLVSFQQVISRNFLRVPLTSTVDHPEPQGSKDGSGGDDDSGACAGIGEVRMVKKHVVELMVVVLVVLVVVVVVVSEMLLSGVMEIKEVVLRMLEVVVINMLAGMVKELAVVMKKVVVKLRRFMLVVMKILAVVLMLRQMEAVILVAAVVWQLL